MFAGNNILDDIELSLKAKGLYLIMDSMNNSEITIDKLSTMTKDGKSSVSSAMKELKDNGWISYKKNSSGTGSYILFDTPIEVKKENIKINGNIYIILGESGRYKIGVSGNIKNRISSLRVSSSEKLKISHTAKVADPYKTEKELHDIFRDKNTHGEWFELNSNDLKDAISYLSDREVL